MTLTMVDAAYPYFGMPAADAEVGYLGGDDLNTWSATDWRKSSSRYRAGIWVWNLSGGTPVTDANTAVDRWRALGAPKATTIFIDEESTVEPGYVAAWSAQVAALGYRPGGYGSLSNITQNVVPGRRYWVADPGATEIPSWAWGVQNQFAGSYDLSIIRDVSFLWDTHAAPPVHHSVPEEAMLHYSITDPTGLAWKGTRTFLWSPGQKPVHLPDAESEAGAAKEVPLVAMSEAFHIAQGGD